MKITKILSIIAFSVPIFSHATITQSLSVGMTSDQVVELQQILNQDNDTKVALSGPGSPGLETRFFGAATKSAVIRFQEKYKSEVLTPAGLSFGTGFVGSQTKQKLNSVKMAKNKDISTGGQSIRTQDNLPSVIKKVEKDTNTSPAKSFADKIQFDKTEFLNAIDKVGLEQGYTKEQLTNLKDLVNKDIEKNHPEKRFVETVEKSGVKIHDETVAKKTGGLFTVFEKVLDFFTPEKTYASGTPFGGRVVFSFFCTCSGNWLVTLIPAGPTYATLLTYYPGTQMYMGYNLPFTLNVLGQYTQGSTCQLYVGWGCASIPSQGMISPTVGSSSI